MTATTSTTALATIQPAFTDAERLALAGSLAGYRGLTREAYTLDLRQFTGWCRIRSLSLFAVRRADIETFARGLEALRIFSRRSGTRAGFAIAVTGCTRRCRQQSSWTTGSLPNTSHRLTTAPWLPRSTSPI